MPCSETVVSGGQWEGETPAPENVAIICYLDAIRLVPSDEPYLPSANIVELVTWLHGLGNADIINSLLIVINSVSTAAAGVKTRSEHVSSLVAALSALR